MNKSMLFLQIFISFFLLTACVHQDTSSNMGPSLSRVSYLEADARTMTGAYLAGRFAQHNSDWKAASHFMQQVLLKDDGNTNLLHRTFLLALGDGNFSDASQLAEQIIASGKETELAYLMMIVRSINDGDTEKAWKYTQDISDSQFNNYMRPVLQAWLLVMMGSEDIALESLKKQVSVFDNDPLYLLHVALISEYAGKYDEADEFYRKVMYSNDVTIHSALTVASYYERRGEHDKAEAIYKDIGEQLHAYKALNLEDMTKLVGRASENPKDAVSLVLFELSTLLFERKAYDSALIYTRLAQVVSPSSPFIKIMLGDISAAQGNYDEAVKSYKSVDKDTGMLRFVRLKAAETLEANGQREDAIELLIDAAEQEKSQSETLVYLGDIYRRHKEYSKAIDAYDTALGRIDNLTKEHWSIIYARGMAQERLNNWEKAEKDLLRALELQPENPLVLNYLGYSWVDKGINMNKAVAMIKKAVVLRPGNGYITDSYGWALYRSGAYDEAVEWLEYSAERIPYDMTINDHLGDAYWRVNRKTEAIFQWRRAYNATDNIQEQRRIEKKIKFGLVIDDKLPVEREAMLH